MSLYTVVIYQEDSFIDVFSSRVGTLPMQIAMLRETSTLPLSCIGLSSYPTAKIIYFGNAMLAVSFLVKRGLSVELPTALVANHQYHISAIAAAAAASSATAAAATAAASVSEIFMYLYNITILMCIANPYYNNNSV